MNQSALQQARQGNPKAITHLLNRSLQKQNICARVSLEDGCLDVMLDAAQVPVEAVAEFIHNGLQKLNSDKIYTINIYGRKAGEHFATWSRRFELRTKPTASLLKTSKLSNDISDQRDEKWKLTLSQDSGKTLDIDIAQLIGFAGTIFLLIGIFAPVVSIPGGTISFFKNGSSEGFLLFGFTIVSITCLVKERFDWLYGSGLWTLLLIGSVFTYYDLKLSELKSSVDRELAGNPFRGFADVAMASVQLQWGWSILFLGSVLVLVAAYLRQRKLNKQAFLSIGAGLIVALAFLTVQSIFISVEGWELETKARQTEAKTYIGAINRGQQAYRLENPAFASNSNELDLGINTESDDYIYQISTEQDMTVATAIAKQRGLRSYTGAVFLIRRADDLGETTAVILCESNRPTRTAPTVPTLANGSLQCSPGSAEPNRQSN